MHWAIDSSGTHIEAGTNSARGYGLRCPCCKALVYHRHGSFNRPHFAHYSGRSNRTCELYYPSHDATVGNGHSAIRGAPTNGFSSPALVWRDSASLTASLHLRLPRLPEDYSSSIRVQSLLGIESFREGSLCRTRFTPLPLHSPPAVAATAPRDDELDFLLEDVLSQFRLTDNYFRATATGGILERSDATLELGAAYILVSQRALSTPQPPSLIAVGEARQQRSWTVQRFQLRDDPELYAVDIPELTAYLGRHIVPPKPRIEFIWPSPMHHDLDGAPVFSEFTRQLIVRSPSGPPKATTTDFSSLAIEDLGDSLYQVALIPNIESEIAVTGANASRMRLAFAAESFASPAGVSLRSSDRVADLVCAEAVELARRAGKIEITVPSELLWRTGRINGIKLKPLPNGFSLEILSPVESIDFGAFGRAHVQRAATSSTGGHWTEKVDILVRSYAGEEALSRLQLVAERCQLFRWAIENNALHILPLVISAYPDEVERVIP